MRNPPSIWLRNGLWLASFLVLASCAKSDYVRLFHSAERAPSYTTDEIEGLQHMGPTFVDNGVNFAVYSEHATKMQLLLFDGPDDERPSHTYEMTRLGNVWNVYVEGLGEGQIYGFVAWGPNWPYDSKWFCGSITGFQSDVDDSGNRFDPNKLLLDPYSYAITRDFDWSKGNPASGPYRTVCDYAAAMKSVLVRSHYKWGDEEKTYRANREDPNFKGHKWSDLIVYETHPKGFTASSASGVDHPGTFRGIGEKADYFKDLGITAVELMPTFEKPLDGGYWGYQTIGFFTPELTYASLSRPGEPQDEFKWMVEELHKRGIEVLLDVVYNHTGEGGLWRQKIQYGGASFDPHAEDPRYYQNLDPKEEAGLYEFRGLDNSAYYALAQDPAYYSDNTGVGNEMRANHLPMRRLILDSLRYWVTDMHVDGFRFDLGPVLGERDISYSCWDDTSVQSTVLQDIIDDPVLQKWNTRIIAEPWSLNCYMVSRFPNSTNYPGDGWYEWNGPFRDTWRQLVNFDWSKLSDTQGPGGRQDDIGGDLFGSQSMFGPSGRSPYNAVNFITIHDGFTMYDTVSYDVKQNGCSPLAPDCCQPVTALCNNDGTDDNKSRDWNPPYSKADAELCGANKDCENYCDTQGTNQQNCIQWWCGADQGCLGNLFNQRDAMKRQIMRDFFVAMMVSRGTPMLLGGDEWMRTQLGNNNAWYTRADNEFNWYDWGAWEPDKNRQRMHDFVKQVIRFRKDHAYAFATDSYPGPQMVWRAPDGSTNVNWNGRSLMVDYPDTTKGPRLLVLINMELGPVDFQLPQGVWHRLIDTQAYYDDPHGYNGQPSFFEQTGAADDVSANASLDAPPVVPGSDYNVPSRNIVVLQAE